MKTKGKTLNTSKSEGVNTSNGAAGSPMPAAGEWWAA